MDSVALPSAVITREKAVALLLDACPSFIASQHWRAYQEDWANEPEQPLYLFASALVLHLTELNAADRREEFPGVFAVIEQMHTEGDDYVRELATIGFMEDLQSTNMHPDGSAPVDFLGWLSPVSHWWWDEVELFWQGRIPYVGASKRPKPLASTQDS